MSSASTSVSEPRQKKYQAEVIVETTGLTNEEWLAYRRTGIGGSDVAAILGVSPFMTARDIYYDKLNIVSAIDDGDNWVQKKIGHLLEDLVAEIFHRKTGYHIFQVKKMFRHPLHPFMIADVDYFIDLPDGSIAILEIKTTNHNATGKWWNGDTPVIPLNYELQTRHYMSVMNINKVYICCLYGNNDNEVIIRQLDRDPAYESEMIALEEYFWENNILAQNPPPYIEDGDLILESVRRHFGDADPKASAITLNKHHSVQLARYLEFQQQKNELDKQVKMVDDQMKRVKGIIVAEMGTSCRADCEIDGVPHVVTFNPSYRHGVEKNNLERFKIQHPDLYDQFVTVTQSRRFYVKPVEKQTSTSVSTDSLGATDSKTSSEIITTAEKESA